MLVRVEFVGLPELRKQAGSRQICLELQEATLGTLLEELQHRYGFVAKKSLLAPQGGQVDQSIQILKNEHEWLSREDLETPLKNGDKITFMLMVAGG
ncbi:MAG: MoaD/ThiS family protein [bacterium]